MRVGLTGGIGSGKSTVVKMFQELGIPVYISDIEAKRLMVSSKKIKKSLIDLFGAQVYVNGELNRPFLADKIFKDKKLLQKVNAIVHPVVRRSFNIWASKQQSAYVIQESAILFENQLHHHFDKIIMVTAPEAVRINRVQQRDGVAEADVRARMNHQWKDEQKISLADFVIENVDLKITRDQVCELHKKLTSLARSC